MNLKLLSKLKTRDAALVYEYLFERTNRAAGVIAATSFEKLSAEMTAAGLKTARAANFTVAVLRSKFAELEAVDVIQRAESDSGAFDLYIFLPYPAETKETAPTTPEAAPDPYGGKTLFDFHNENENENENVEREHETTPSSKEYIYINNKQKNKTREEVREEVEDEATDADDRPTTDAIRERVDFTIPKIARFRAEIVRRVWEREINPDLIDRLAALAVLKVGGTSAQNVFSICTEAKQAAERYERTDGRSGRAKIWHTIGYTVKRIYEANGWRWTRTKIGNEPKPEADGVARALAAINASADDE